MIKLSRRKLADHVTMRLARDDDSKSVMDELAAYLVDTKRTNEALLIIRDIESTLAKSGTVLARVMSARPLETEATAAIERYVSRHTNASRVELMELIDESVIGGVRIKFPGSQLDATVKAKLDKLTA